MLRTLELRDRSWYYTPAEWSRHIGWGEVPDERNWLLLSDAQKKIVIATSLL